jgi:hypothetical protein
MTVPNRIKTHQHVTPRLSLYWLISPRMSPGGGDMLRRCGARRGPLRARSAITGPYLFAVDQRYGPDTAFAGVGYLTPASVPVALAGATAARSAALGPIVGPPRPRVTPTGRSRIRDGRLPIARIQSSARCQVFAIATGKRARRTVRLTIHGTGIVSVPWTSSDGDRLNVQLFVGDGPPIDAVTHV